MQQIFNGTPICWILWGLQRCSQVALSLVGCVRQENNQKSTKNEMRVLQKVQAGDANIQGNRVKENYEWIVCKGGINQ